jgi:AraC-like DNA-binding protein
MQGTWQTYREHVPARPLRRHVACIWVQEVAVGSAAYEHRTVPNGGVEIACALGSSTVVVGPQSGPTLELLEPGSVVVGARLRPGATPSLLGLPASALVDVSVDAAELLGDWAIVLGERLAAAASPRAAAAILEAQLLARSLVAASPDPLVSETVLALFPGRGIEVGSLAGALYISERQLRRRCTEAVGFAPKALQRMLRFQGFLALAQGRGHSGDELARLAAEAGYADQSHLTRESVRLAGLPPAALLRESGEKCGAAHDHAASYGPLLRWHATG